MWRGLNTELWGNTKIKNDELLKKNGEQSQRRASRKPCVMWRCQEGSYITSQGTLCWFLQQTNCRIISLRKISKKTARQNKFLLNMSGGVFHLSLPGWSSRGKMLEAHRHWMASWDWHVLLFLFTDHWLKLVRPNLSAKEAYKLWSTNCLQVLL